MRTLLIAVLALAVAPSMAFAGGGGGTKASGTIEVTNNSQTGEQLAVILDANASDFDDEQEFLDAGGRIIGPGETARFTNVRTGNHRLSVAFIDDLTGEPGTPTTRNNVNVTRGKTLRFRVNGTAAGGASIAVIQ